MDIAVERAVHPVHFWDGYARWHKQWAEHTDYYAPFLDLIKDLAEPGCRVLDVGAGDGVLSVPLCFHGCDVTALKPSVGMRNLLFERAFKDELDTLKVDDRRWEDVPVFECRGFNLVVASNSLHLTTIGFDAALKKVFDTDPDNVLLITEQLPDTQINFAYPTHVVRFGRAYEIDDSFAYHHVSEAFEHQRFIRGRELLVEEEYAIANCLTLHDGHVWLEAKTRVGAYWFQRRDNSACPALQ
jgi:hypothetical protein